MRTGFRRYGRLVRRSLFGTRGTQARLTPYRALMLILFLPAFLAVQLMHWLGFLLDEVLFPGYRNVTVHEPVFIVGVPRSGTTFLHRVLSCDTRYTTFTLWELVLAPSVTERRFWLALGAVDNAFGRPLGRLRRWLERRFFGQFDSLHKVSLDAPEEDYLALLPICACLLLTLPFPFPDELGYLARFDEEATDAEKRHVMDFYRRCLQRHLYVHGPDKRLLSKNAAFGGMVGTLGEAFPDCRVIATMRSPFAAVPSLISSMQSGADSFGNDTAGPAFRNQMVEMMQHFYAHLTDTLSQWPEDRHCFVTMDRMKGDLAPAVRTIYLQLEIPMTDAFAAALEREAASARDYRSGHTYSLDQFELRPDAIVRDFAVAFERFGFSPDPG